MHSWHTFTNTNAISGCKESLMSKLTEEERERVKDSKHSIQSAAASLSRVDPRKIPKLEEVEECLENADKVLREALQAPSLRERSPHDGRRQEHSFSGSR